MLHWCEYVIVTFLCHRICYTSCCYVLKCILYYSILRELLFCEREREEGDGEWMERERVGREREKERSTPPDTTVKCTNTYII